MLLKQGFSYSLSPVTWWHRSLSTLALVMACCQCHQAITWTNANELGLEAFNPEQFHQKCSTYLSLIWIWKFSVNSLRPSDILMHQYIMPALVQIMACHLFGAKPLSEPMLPYYQLDPKEHISLIFYLKFKCFHSRKCTWKCCQNDDHLARPQWVKIASASPRGQWVKYHRIRAILTVSQFQCCCYLVTENGSLKRNYPLLATLRPEHNGQHVADDILKCISLNEKYGIIQIWL